MIGFTRTTCACPECVSCCKRQPGPLAPGDLERIAGELGESVEDAKRYFVASKGALVANLEARTTFRVGTITPRSENGRCVFLDDADRCRIHAVAPAGCAYFDMHMTGTEALPRATALIHMQMTDDYQRLRATLPERK